MTEQDVFNMAREVCGKWPSFMSNPNLQAFAKLVAAKEREACAKLCETALYQLQETMNELSSSEYMEQCVVQGAMNQAVKLTKAIRARGEA